MRQSPRTGCPWASQDITASWPSTPKAQETNLSGVQTGNCLGGKPWKRKRSCQDRKNWTGICWQSKVFSATDQQDLGRAGSLGTAPTAKEQSVNPTEEAALRPYKHRRKLLIQIPEWITCFTVGCVVSFQNAVRATEFSWLVCRLSLHLAFNEQSPCGIASTVRVHLSLCGIAV